MAKGRFRSVGEVLPATLGALAGRGRGEAPSRAEIALVWSQLFAGPMARASRPVELAGGTLKVEVDGALWKRELEGREAALLARLERPLGGAVRRLAFRLSRG